MPKAAKVTEALGVPLSQIADGDVLHFLSRTLQAHILDAEPHGMQEKLQNLLTALAQQEATLSDWPASPSKDRICAALVKARTAVSRIVDELDNAGQSRADTGAAKAM